MKMLSKMLVLLCLPCSVYAAQVSFTMDDPGVQESVLLSPPERNQKILKAFSDAKIRAMLFTSGKKIDSPEGRALLQTWDEQGHFIANHSYAHLNFNSETISFETFREDFLKVEPLISNFKHFKKFFRFPFLKEGDTAQKRDQMRDFLKEKGYQQGYVTIDASDWYIDGRLIDRLRANPQTDVKRYRDFYLRHIWDRSQYYDQLAKKIYGREIKHTLLIHHSLLNALFLGDLIRMYRQKGWKPISAELAYTDPIFMHSPNILPAGESVVWADAKATGKFDSILRYPGEDGDYEKSEMDRLGL